MPHPESKYTIGRALTCDIVLADASVSRVHAELTFLANGSLLLTDCRSTQGTTVLRPHGQRTAVRQALLSALDTLRFGTVSMSVQELLKAIALKQAQAVGQGGQVQPHAAPAALPPAGAGLLRCDCGAVKVRAQACAVCGA